MIPRSARRYSLTALALVTACVRTPAVITPSPAGVSVSGLRLDPMLLVSVAETRRILTAMGDSLYPGLAAERIPLLLYRPGVQDVLVGFPKTPTGFRPVRAALLGGETVLLRDDSTYLDVDDQNTNRMIDSVHPR